MLQHAKQTQLGFPQLLGQVSKGTENSHRTLLLGFADPSKCCCCAGNKRQRILRELTMHASSTLSGGAMGIRLDYFELLRHKLTQPLRRDGVNGVQPVIGMLEELQLSKDDWDSLVVEFGLGPDKLVLRCCSNCSDRFGHCF